MKSNKIILILTFLLTIADQGLAQSLKFDFGAIRKIEQAERDIRITTIDRADVSSYTTYAIVTNWMKDMLFNYSLLDNFEKVNPKLYEKFNRPKYGTAILLKPYSLDHCSEDPISFDLFDEDILVFHLCDSKAMDQLVPLMNYESYGKIAPIIECKVYVVTMYEGRIRKTACFVDEVSVLGMINVDMRY